LDSSLIGAVIVPSESAPVIRRSADIYEMPSSRRTRSYPLDLEGIVIFHDPLWRSLWIQREGIAEYFFLSSKAPSLQAGQRVRLRGTVVPDAGLSSDRVEVTVLEESCRIPSLSARGRIDDLHALNSRMVELEGLVDTQQDIDGGHLRLNMIVEGRPVIAWVKPSHHPVLPSWEGKFVRLTGLYSSRFDMTGAGTYLEIWVGAESQVTVLHSLADAPGFLEPTRSVDGLYGAPEGQLVRISGRLQSQSVGDSLVVRRGSAQILAYSVQRLRLPRGASVDLYGHLGYRGGRCVIERAIYRPCPHEADHHKVDEAALSGVLTSIDAVRSLDLKEAALGRKVSLSGMVTWAMADTGFFFLQDVSGGIRVRFSPEVMSAPPLVKALHIEGVTVAGTLLPEIEIKSYQDLGARNAPPPKPITLDLAAGGHEDCQWVSVRGFLRRVVSDNDWRWIHVTTPAGDVIAHLQSPVNFVATPGSLIRIQGVCDTAVDLVTKESSVILRVPFLHDISIEENAPVALFDLPQTPIPSLRALLLDRDLTRVRISGVVTASGPDYVHVQEDGVGILLLLTTGNPPALGERVDAVGILGNEGPRPVLREAVMRSAGQGVLPQPIPLTYSHVADRAKDGLLVSAEGVLLDVLQQADRTKLSLQQGNAIYETYLPRKPGSEPARLPEIGAVLSVRGIFRQEYDEFNQSRGLIIRLRSQEDITVREPARFLTRSNALMLLSILGCIVVIVALWSLSLRRRVRRQTGLIKAQLEHQHRQQAGVMHAARLESLGIMAGGIAHDFNNSLTVIMGNLGLAMVYPDGDRSVGLYLREAMKGATRARELTHELLTFARGGNPIREELDVVVLVEAVLGGINRPDTIRLAFDRAPGLRPAHGDRKQLAVVLHNIIINAVQAMPQGGLLSLGVSCLRISPQGHEALSAGAYVCISVADSGVGIAQDILPKIFDPYFSTKPGCSGLGLASAYSIVRQHQGHIEVISEVGRGSLFKVFIPVYEAPVGAVESVVPISDGAAVLNGAKVLVMDDEDSIRKVLAILLSRMGMHVVEAARGEEALRLFKEARSAAEPFDLVILDLTIPGGMGGKDAMREIRLIDPTVPSIVSSGYSSDPVMADYQQYGFSAVVPKPYEVEHLLSAILRLLAPGEPKVGK